MEVPEGDTFEVYNARPGEVPALRGVMVREGRTEHWYLSERYQYPAEDSDVVLVLRRADDARPTDEHDRYIRVAF